MRINFFHYELTLFKNEAIIQLTSLQKRILMAASVALGCLIACIYLYRLYNSSKEAQLEGSSKKIDISPVLNAIKIDIDLPRPPIENNDLKEGNQVLEGKIEDIDTGPNLSNEDIPLYNHFMQEFSGSTNAKYKNIIGKVNKLVSSVYIECLGNKELFDNKIQALPIEDSLKDKALLLGNKYFAIYSKIQEFKIGVGGLEFATSNNTLELAKLYELYIEGTIDRKQLYDLIDSAPKTQISGPSKANAKRFIKEKEDTEALTLLPTSKLEIVADKPTTTAAHKFQWNSSEINENYKKLSQDNKIKVRRSTTGFIDIKNFGGAVNVGYQITQQNPDAIIGIMLAGNSGLPGGALGKRPNAVTAEDLKMTTQEESIWADAVLTNCGTDSEKQQSFHENTISGKWGNGESEGYVN